MVSSELKNSDVKLLKIALNLARRGVGLTGANPSVGCVITLGGTIIGRGNTNIKGKPHAEIIAIKQARNHYLYQTSTREEAIKVYVTLEPCAHSDSSPSCASELVKLGVDKVFFIIKDPDKRTCGKGLRILESAGIECIQAKILEEENLDVIGGYLKRKQHRKPHISLKIACSVNGKTGTKSGESKWITGNLSRKKVQLIRSSHDAILVGKRTILNDNPQLNLRDEFGSIPQKFIFILDSNLEIPYSKELNIIKNNLCEKIFIFTDKKCNKKKLEKVKELNLNPIIVSKKNGKLDLSEIINFIGKLEINRLLVEGGSSTWTTFIKEKLFDDIILFWGNTILNGSAMPAIKDFLPVNASIESFPRLKLKSFTNWGENIEAVWTVN